MKKIDPIDIHDKLEKQLAALEKQIANLGDLEPRLGQNPDRGSLAQSYAAQEKKRTLFSQLHADLAATRKALGRLADGSYGDCQRCGERIAVARLEALPHAVFCIRCQTLAEAHVHGVAG